MFLVLKNMAMVSLNLDFQEKTVRVFTNFINRRLKSSNLINQCSKYVKRLILDKLDIRS